MRWVRAHALQLAGATAVLAVLLAMIVAVLYATQQTSTSADLEQVTVQNCKQIELIKAQITETVKASTARLPTIEYYKTHPDELAQALEESAKSIRTFRPLPC